MVVKGAYQLTIGLCNKYEALKPFRELYHAVLFSEFEFFIILTINVIFWHKLIDKFWLNFGKFTYFLFMYIRNTSEYAYAHKCVD